MHKLWDHRKKNNTVCGGKTQVTMQAMSEWGREGGRETDSISQRRCVSVLLRWRSPPSVGDVYCKYCLLTRLQSIAKKKCWQEETSQSQQNNNAQAFKRTGGLPASFFPIAIASSLLPMTTPPAIKGGSLCTLEREILPPVLGRMVTTSTKVSRKKVSLT